MALKKPSEVFKKNNEIVSVDTVVQDLEKTSNLNTFSEAFNSFKINLEKIETFSETLDTYLSNVEKVNYLSKEVQNIQIELQNYITKENLDRVILSQLLVVEQTIREIQNKIKSINERKVAEIRSDVSNLTEVVNDFITVEIPKYQFNVQNYCENLEENVKQNFEIIEEVIDKNQESVSETVLGLLDKFKDIEILSEKVSNEFRGSEELSEKVSNLQIEIVRNETHIKVQNKTLNAIQEEVKDTLSKINLEEFEQKSHKLGQKIKYLEEVFEKFSEREILTENIIVEPSSTSNKDPLTPLDKNFVTLEQLQEHYRLFINRIQQQLATLGGGGETQLKYLDDIVGIATNPSVYDGKFLTYDHSIKKFEFVTVTQGGGGNVAIAITNVAPTSPTEGNLWYDNEIGRTFLYYTDEDGSQWVDVAPSGTSPGTGTGSSIGVYGGYPNFVGVVTAIDFGSNLTVSAVSSGIVTVTASGALGGSSYWVETNAGIHTLSNVGIGTTNLTSKLTVGGDGYFTGVVSATTFIGDLIGTATYATNAGVATYASTAGIATYATNAGVATYASTAGISTDVIGGIASVTQLDVSGITTLGVVTSGNIYSTGIITATFFYGSASLIDTRLNSVSEQSVIGTGNTISLVYNTGGGNIGIITSPSGPITLSVTGIPTDSTFDNRTLTFSVMVNQGVTGYACSTVTLNGVSSTVKYPGAVVSTGSTSAYDIFNFTCINPVGSASTTSNYVVLGMVNGNFK